MPAFDRISATRVVARPSALDGADIAGDVMLMRIAPDELLVMTAGAGREPRVTVDDPHAIVVDERGFVGAALTPNDLAATVLPFVDWTLPSTVPALAQGLVAGIPAKLWLHADGALLVCAAPYAVELAERLGWDGAR